MHLSASISGFIVFQSPSSGCEPSKCGRIINITSPELGKHYENTLMIDAGLEPSIESLTACKFEFEWYAATRVAMIAVHEENKPDR